MLPSKVAFLITKPLQLLVSLAIVKDEGLSQASVDLVVVDDFFDAQTHADTLGRLWRGRVCFKDSHWAALKFVGRGNYSRVFIDSDVGLKRFAELGIVRNVFGEKSFWVYEEGIGTYRDDLYKGLKKKIFATLGIGVYFGGALWTEGVCVYDPGAYARNLGHRKPVKEIRTKIIDVIYEYDSVVRGVFSVEDIELFMGARRNKTCAVYMSDWNFDQHNVDRCRLYGADLYVKPHPNIKALPCGVFEDGVFVVKNSVPAEVLLGMLSGGYEEVFVYHHGSSVVNYVFSRNVKYIKI